jgi:hypothetical protein
MKKRVKKGFVRQRREDDDAGRSLGSRRKAMARKTEKLNLNKLRNHDLDELEDIEEELEEI